MPHLVFTVSTTSHILHRLTLQQSASAYLHTREKGGREGGMGGMGGRGIGRTEGETATRHTLPALLNSFAFPLGQPPIVAYVPSSGLGSPIVAESDATGGGARDRDGRNYRAFDPVHFQAQLLAVEREREALAVEVQKHFDAAACLNA